MNKTLSFVRLDFITIKPYLTLKNLFIFAGSGLVMMITSGGSISAIGLFMMYAALYVSFAVGEKNGIDALYATLSIKRSNVVLGRYLYGLTVDVCVGLLAYVFTFVTLTALRKDFDPWGSLIFTFAAFWVFSVIQAVQLPTISQ